MSFFRHRQIYQSDLLFRPRSEAVCRFAPGFIVLMSLRPVIPRQVGLHQSPPPLLRLDFILNSPAKTVNHHPTGAGEFSTGEMRNFQPALTEVRRGAEARQRTALGESARPAPSHPARLGCVLQPGYAANGIPGRRSSRLHARPVISDSATQGAVARRRAISGHRSVRIVWGAAVAQHPFVVVVVSPG
jgi:hypothetical protein